MKHNKEKIFWLGSVLQHDALKKYKGESPASSAWLRGVLSGFQSHEVELKVFSPIWDALFPKGSLFPGNQTDLDANFEQQKISYLNFPSVRTLSVAFGLVSAIEKEIKKNGLPAVIINYNTYPHYVKTQKILKAKYPSIKWINYVLDLDDPRTDNWQSFIEDTKGADASIFLSWWGFENAPVANKLHVDAGWFGQLPVAKYNQTGEKVFLYAGKLSDSDDLSLICEVIKSIKNKNVSFEFYGKGSHKGLEKLSVEDKRVKIKGFVSDEDLHKACENADCFLSPRDMNDDVNLMIFPSKIMHYLLFQKPILSPRLPGLSPEYNDVLFFIENNDCGGWVTEIEKLTSITEEEWNLNREKAKALLALKKWDMQVKKILDFAFISNHNND